MTKKVEAIPLPPPPKAARFDKANLTKRLVTAAIFTVLFFTLLYFGESFWAKSVWFGFCVVILVLGVREIGVIAQKNGQKPSTISGSLLGIGLLTHFFLGGGDSLRAGDALPLWLVLVMGSIVIHFGSLLFYKNQPEDALGSHAVTWLSGLYLGLGLGFTLKLFMYNETTLSNTGARLLLGLFLIVWFGDTGAYFIGTRFGKHKIAPKISPKKSWEGVLGNYLGNLTAAFIIKAWVCVQWSAVDAIAIGLLLGTIGQLGDLVESSWKRSAGIKDSGLGISIPGHGGVLDRIDSLIFAAPALYAYVHFIHGLN